MAAAGFLQPSREELQPQSVRVAVPYRDLSACLSTCLSEETHGPQCPALSDEEVGHAPQSRGLNSPPPDSDKDPTLLHWGPAYLWKTRGYRTFSCECDLPLFVCVANTAHGQKMKCAMHA